MFKSLWFIVKVVFLIAVSVWMATQPGFVKIEWMDYLVRVHAGVLFLAFLAILMLAIFVYNVIRTFVDFPGSYRRYREIKNRDNGYRALTAGLTSMAAGDAKDAARQAGRAEKLLKEDDNALVLMLKAQAARFEGRGEDARRHFVRLLEHKDAAFLGLRGLLQAALDKHDYAGALELGHKALRLHPKQPWILRIVYELELRRRHWSKAREILRRAERAGAVTPAKALSDQVAILLAEADEETREEYPEQALKKTKKAVNFYPSFTPGAVRLARLYMQNGKRRLALSVIESGWKAMPHPAYITLWQSLTPRGKSKASVNRLQWMERLLSLNPAAAEGQLAAAQIAIEEGLWGEARHFLMRAEEIEASAPLYKLHAELEERSAGNREAVKRWLEKAANAKPGPFWLCRESGCVYDDWYPVALPHGSFNTIEWGYPNNMAGESAAISVARLQAPDILDQTPLIAAGF